MKIKDTPNFEISKESIKKFFPKTDIDISGYKSPIEIIVEQMITTQENAVFHAVQELGINIDKKELLKALKYDRDQYEKGYNDGYFAGSTANKWISVDERLPEKTDEYLIVKNGKITIGYFSAEYKKFALWNRDQKVTHWQPLPEPPKEDAE